ncbi:cbb3-type cytochrome c oxidase subunit I [Aquibacillus koreensis]|uniref:Cbb3-type cytochrome c oxidase subunit I n=1 Tax=Aquibacillus koreensis TaxID=279446 RepID=A0A9X3WKD7_9BACI|nr:cbb3-type cytochrome c oxidase subunit I [Aquibacillus koreensis]MCT2536339.1 cbb3-type cytochrome c oxidase subunit I [Aquibacillus koreensis]MDC3421310.1 cbb3-type cytochrome c oxidase subunit I [Aquibacillus koreensis]
MEQTLKETKRQNPKKLLGVNTEDAKVALSYFTVAFVSLLLGGILGLLQGLERADLIQLPSWLNYYQVLTAHGLLLLVVFTATFTIGYQFANLSHSFGGLLPKVRKLAWIGFGLMVFGVALVTVMIILNEASVLYTFYPPLAAHPLFYVGLVFVVVGIWACCFGVFINYRHWRKNHRGQVTPLLAYFAMGVFVLWFFASIGVTIEVLTLIPWSMGLVETTNVMVARTLFWWFGHTLVNIWYLVATSAWYVIVPKIIGGRHFNEKLIRLVVILIVVLNIPGGFHHQIIDPAISTSIKFLHVFMSLSIAVPSLMTAFAMFFVFERTGRKLGGKGLLGWLKKLPWGDVRFLAPMIAMISFIPGGAGGIVNTSNQLNQVVHNTMWVVGHFHVTVGMSVVLTFFGICYWLIPYLSKRQLTPKMNKIGVIQTIVWTVGMTIMAGSMHIAGLFGDPRRTSDTSYGGHEVAASWISYELIFGIGATILLVGVLIQVYAVFNMMFFAPKGETEFPVAEPEDNAAPVPLWTERWGLWIVLLLAVVAMAYVVPIVDMILNAPPGSPPIRTW